MADNRDYHVHQIERIQQLEQQLAIAVKGLRWFEMNWGSQVATRFIREVEGKSNE